MLYLLDTSILGRLANNHDVQYSVAIQAVSTLHRRGETMHITPQVLIEFRNVATRPVAVNGLGLTLRDTESLVEAFEARFPLLPETPDIFPHWKALVTTHGVIGKQVHDARLVAVCLTHHITHILTFNVSHFVRWAKFGSGMEVVDPATV